MRQRQTERAVSERAIVHAAVKGLLKAELKRRNVGYRELAERLAVLGIHETEHNIANKISRGGFTAVFMVQCLVAIGAKTLALPELDS